MPKFIFPLIILLLINLSCAKNESDVVPTTPGDTTGTPNDSIPTTPESPPRKLLQVIITYNDTAISQIYYDTLDYTYQGNLLIKETVSGDGPRDNMNIEYSYDANERPVYQRMNNVPHTWPFFIITEVDWNSNPIEAYRFQEKVLTGDTSRQFWFYMTLDSTQAIIQFPSSAEEEKIELDTGGNVFRRFYTLFQNPRVEVYSYKSLPNPYHSLAVADIRPYTGPHLLDKKWIDGNLVEELKDFELDPDGYVITAIYELNGFPTEFQYFYEDLP